MPHTFYTHINTHHTLMHIQMHTLNIHKHIYLCILTNVHTYRHTHT